MMDLEEIGWGSMEWTDLVAYFKILQNLPWEIMELT
jgi:hypothetical protein